MVSATEPDWSLQQVARLTRHPSLALLVNLRAFQRHAARRHPVASLLRRWAALRHRFWSVFAGADIPVTCQLGWGLLMPHPNGIVSTPMPCPAPTACGCSR